MATTKQKREFRVSLTKRTFEILQASSRENDLADVMIEQQKALGVK
ncbi:hypothetical protein WOSG25_360010 [Weissella oryzae SG25]|uniref:Uncharacterized protein n=1 Tax=Weissella oryzae (strain DSM 25784 / JCM 18191 / LMG 30913 / SG25) TaxID=1329250 RepID=A0A069CX97_WEIOS|nr:hypothetical protein [Weissella oryzae]GAK32094.1 hypothetical protein WOSG25_360010 [Weissella oryzae SG25]